MTAPSVHLNQLKDAAQDPAEFARPEWLELVQHLEASPQARQQVSQALPWAVGRLKDLQVALDGRFTGKTGIIEQMLYCAVAQEPMLIFGEPGTAKTALVKRFSEALGLRRLDPSNPDPAGGLYYEYLLTSFTEPDELLGPVIVKDLLLDRPQFVRYQAGMLPDAAVVFLDEVFRANSAILNTLLSLINERIVYEAGGARRAKTLMVFGAANQAPVSPELHAFFERFPIRTRSLPVSDEQRLAMFQKGWQLEKESRNGLKPTPPLSCLTDLALCNKAILLELYPVDGAFIRRYAGVVEKLNHDARGLCAIDDRKFIKLYKVMCARALLLQMKGPERDDLVVLQHTWRDFEVIDTLRDSIERLG